MKYIVAIIQPDRLDDVLDILEKKEIHLVTVSNVMGRGRQKGLVGWESLEPGHVLQERRLEPRKKAGCKGISPG